MLILYSATLLSGVINPSRPWVEDFVSRMERILSSAHNDYLNYFPPTCIPCIAFFCLIVLPYLWELARTGMFLKDMLVSFLIVEKKLLFPLNRSSQWLGTNPHAAAILEHGALCRSSPRKGFSLGLFLAKKGGIMLVLEINSGPLFYCSLPI